MPRASKTYVVKQGRIPGVYHTWAEAKAQVEGYSGAQFKSFTNPSEASAYMDSGLRSRFYAKSESSRIQDCTSSNKGKAETNGGEDQSFLANNSSPHEEHIFVDGSSLSNGKEEASAGWANYFGDNDPRNSSGPIDGAQTNNRAELTAMRRALDHVCSTKKTYVIHTDSDYSMKAVTLWGEKWEKSGWKRGDEVVKNQDLIKDIRSTMKKLKEQGYQVRLNKVRGHSNVYGNERADELAKQEANKRRR